MSKVSIEESTLSAIGDAIRKKTGESALLSPLDMPTAISSISGGGGGVERKVLVLTGWSYGNGVTDIKISDYINDYSKIKRLTYRCDRSQTSSGCLDEFIGEKAYSGAVSRVTMNGKSLEYIFNVFDTAFLSKYFINAINNGYYASSDFYRAGQNQVFQMGVTTEGYLTIPMYATNPTNKVFNFIANSFSNGYQYIIIEYEE